MGKRVELLWPPKELWPNSRKDRRGISGIRAKYRQDAWALAREARFSATAHLRITFRPPTAGKRDLDNMLAAIKAGLDGVAQAAGQDDSEWALTIRKGDPARPHGAVVIEAIDEQDEEP